MVRREKAMDIVVKKRLGVSKSAIARQGGNEQKYNFQVVGKRRGGKAVRHQQAGVWPRRVSGDHQGRLQRSQIFHFDKSGKKVTPLHLSYVGGITLKYEHDCKKGDFGEKRDMPDEVPLFSGGA
ncbi:MAG: hypothetical protein M1491_08180 [Deltaproteobacteria bacterium]|nr:hypothetical protein [Deltaproteobacteria bacterium]MCL5278041.1 hypothetical protein [Deltaproteobacteria bacterium]